MTDKELVERLRENAEWARGIEWETPLCLADDSKAAVDTIERLQSELTQEKIDSTNLVGELATVAAERDRYKAVHENPQPLTLEEVKEHITKGHPNDIMMTKTGKCEICGTEFVYAPNRRYCNACAHKRSVASTKAALKRRNERLKQEVSKPQEQPGGWHVVKCTGCYYYRPLRQGGRGAMNACHYLIDTDVPRGIHLHECYKRSGTPYRPGKKV